MNERLDEQDWEMSSNTNMSKQKRYTQKEFKLKYVVFFEKCQHKQNSFTHWRNPKNIRINHWKWYTSFRNEHGKSEFSPSELSEWLFRLLAKNEMIESSFYVESLNHLLDALVSTERHTVYIRFIYIYFVFAIIIIILIEKKLFQNRDLQRSVQMTLF